MLWLNDEVVMKFGLVIKRSC